MARKKGYGLTSAPALPLLTADGADADTLPPLAPGWAGVTAPADTAQYIPEWRARQIADYLRAESHRERTALYRGIFADSVQQVRRVHHLHL